MSEVGDFFLGLMSGTSLDAIDAVLVRFNNQSLPQLIQTHSHSIPATTRSRIEHLCQPNADEINCMGELDIELGELFADAALAVVEKSYVNIKQIRAIGCHGQTIRHHPGRNKPFSIQIGDPNTIAQRTSITTVADFRRMDIAAGGQGAPLVPAFHDAVLRSHEENRAIVNIGGMANLTVLAADSPVTGFDTGPGNVLMNSWIQKHRQQPYDVDGHWARTGQCCPLLLSKLMSHPYLQLSPPKSTGRETFHLAWLEMLLHDDQPLRPEDVQRTLLEFTAQSISQSVAQLPQSIARALLCGGGSHNKLLHERLRFLLPDTTLNSTSDFGVPADWLEAMAFAWLAKQRLDRKPGNITTVTGARHPCILGGVYEPN